MVSRNEKGPLAEWFWTIDRFFVFSFLLLMGLGVMLSFSASPAIAQRLHLETFYFVKKHLIMLIPSIAIMMGLSFFTPRLVRRVSLLLLVLSLLGMVVVLFYGTEIKGAHRWVSFGPVSLQPSEFLKPGFIVICAWLFSQKLHNPRIPGNLMAILLYVLSISLLLAHPDFGQTVLLTSVWTALFFMAGMSWRWIVFLGGFGTGGTFLAYLFFAHVAQRINQFLFGMGDRYQVQNAAKAIVHGSWFGTGPGEGFYKNYIPDSHTDFVFSVGAEEFGIVFCLGLVALFAAIVIRGLLHAFEERDDFTRFAIVGLVLQVGLQSVINIGVNLQLLPAKGMTLPFISSGGSSMLGMSITVGFLLALTRRRPELRARARGFLTRSLAFTSK